MGFRVLCCLLVMTYVSRGLAAAMAIQNNCSSVDGCTCEGTTFTSVICRGLTSLPNADTFATTITEFTFIDCDLPSVSDVPYTTATQLTIRNSNVKDIQDGAFSILTKLVDLDLTSNLLSALRTDMFIGLGSVTTLSLADNNLTVVDDTSLDLVVSVTELNLAQNMGLQLSESALSELTMLEQLDLQTCGLKQVPLSALQQAASVGRVSLNGNPLFSLSHHAFHGLHELNEVNLDSCQLAELSHQAFGGLPNLQKLQLSNNQLTELTIDNLGESSDTLTQLHLEVNQLTTLQNSLLDDWSRVTHLSLHSNPWTCDCTTAWLAELQSDFLQKTVCALPEEHVGQSLFNVTSQLSCPCGAEPCGGTSVVALAIAIPIVIICLALIGYYLYKIWQARRTKEAKRKSVRYSAVYKDTVESAPKGAKGYRGAGSDC